MKKVVLMIVPALICVVMTVSSCKNEKCEKVDKLLWCSGLNIEWYNGNTGELKLKNPDNISKPIGEGDRYLHIGGEQYVKAYAFYLGDEELFVLGAPLSVMSYALNFPVLVDAVANGDYNGSFERPVVKYYIGRGYPNWDYWTEKFWTDTGWDRTADWVKEREKNWKAIEPGLTRFIEQLKKEGKYRE